LQDRNDRFLLAVIFFFFPLSCAAIKGGIPRHCISILEQHQKMAASNLRVVFLGAGLSNLVALAEARSRGACADVLEKSATLDGSSRRFTSTELSEENAAFLQRLGVESVTKLTCETAGAVILATIVDSISKQSPKEVRILWNTEALSVLTDMEHEKVMGVRFKRNNVSSFDGKSKESEANIFGDAFVSSLHQPSLDSLCNKGALVRINNHRVINPDGAPLGNLFLAKDSDECAGQSLDSFVEVARLAGFFLLLLLLLLAATTPFKPKADKQTNRQINRKLISLLRVFMKENEPVKPLP
jgi:hypothetical protein